MTLFAGALLRTIEFVMVTTDASFPALRVARARAGQPSGGRARAEQGAPEREPGTEPGSSAQQLRATGNRAAGTDGMHRAEPDGNPLSPLVCCYRSCLVSATVPHLHPPPPSRIPSLEVGSGHFSLLLLLFLFSRRDKRHPFLNTVAWG